MRGLGILAACALVGLACADAQAARPLQLGIVLPQDAARADANAATAAAEGADYVRITVPWSAIAPRAQPSPGPIDPADPAYDWRQVDAVVQAAAAHGLAPVLMILNAPSWAEGAGRASWAPPGVWQPSPGRLADFASVVARRYDGTFNGLPRVKYFQIWNEPNLGNTLGPQWGDQDPYPLIAAGLYRGLLQAGYAAIKAAQPDSVVLSGGLAPYGNGPPPPSTGIPRSHPVPFARTLFCLDPSDASCPSTVPLDVFDEHALSVGGPFRSAGNDDVSVPDLRRVMTLLRHAERAGTVPGGPHPVWSTETAWDSNPPDPDGVPVARQARWLSQALYVLWRQGVSAAFWLQLYDNPPTPSYASTVQSGLFYLDGSPKPSAQAFVFPFVVRPAGRHVEAWGRAPATGQLLIQRRRGRGWRTVARRRVARHAVFDLRLSVPRKSTLRARVGNVVSPAS